MNKIIKFIIVAFIQGIAEILPISSSAHIIIIEKFLNINTNDLSLSIYLHLASSLSIIIFYRKEIWSLIDGFFKFIFKRKKNYKKDFIYVICLIIATIPAGIGGILFQDLIEKYLITPFLLGCFLILTGVIILVNKYIPIKNDQDLSFGKAWIIGLFQLVGIIPGISRSGITLFGSKVNKLNSRESTKFVFLLLLPISLGSAIIDFSKSSISGNFMETYFSIEYILAFITCVVITLISLKLLINIIKKEKTYLFCYYLFPLGLLLMINGLYRTCFVIL